MSKVYLQVTYSCSSCGESLTWEDGFACYHCRIAWTEDAADGDEGAPFECDCDLLMSAMHTPFTSDLWRNPIQGPHEQGCATNPVICDIRWHDHERPQPNILLPEEQF